MIYFDNAATTYPKPKCVIRAVDDCIKNFCANSGRSSHFLALRTADEIYRTREAVSQAFSLDTPEQTVFTQNATHALNLAIKGLVKPNTRVIISDLEHNSTLRSLSKLKKEKCITVDVFSTKNDIEHNIEELIREDTYAIVSTVASNVTGKIIPIEILSRVAKRHSLKLILDASQIAGHKRIDLSRIYFDAFCAPGHKGLLGIQGSGFLIANKNVKFDTMIEGGSGNNSADEDMPELLPERLEAGTLNTPAIVSIKAGLEYIKNVTQEFIEYRLRILTCKLSERLHAINDIEIFGAENGIVSFRVKGFPCSEIEKALDREKICARSGLHCSPLAHKTLNTSDTGLIRLSLSVFNNETEIDKVYKTILRCIKR